MNERAVTTTSGRKPTFSMMISTEGYQRMISSALKDEQRRNRFIASITSAVAVNPALQECTPQTILSGAKASICHRLPSWGSITLCRSKTIGRE